MVEVTAERFDELVDAALDGIPEALAALVTNLVVLVEDEDPDAPDLLGLYDGTPVTEAEQAGFGPHRVLLFRLPLMDMCADETELTEEVRITVVHEVAHHFGIDDDRLHELGYG
ncbi:MAG: metallopeptidase family protein [Nocardioides sp.]